MNGLKKLFSPYNIGTRALKNRIVMGPMGTNLSNPDGSITPEEIAYYETRARGGAGMIITEMVVVDPRGKYQPRIPQLSNDGHIQGWRSISDAVHEHGTKIAIQLGHAGRETFPAFINGLQPVAPSAVPPPTGIIPKELTVAEIEDLVKKYAQAAGRAVDAGIDAIQVHGAHCYLMANFMSPVTNKRCDEYGGGIEGRLRFSLEVVRAIRKRVGREVPLLFRIAAEEMIPGGRSLEETKVMCRLLVEAGIDAIEVSRGSVAALRWVVPPMGTPLALNLQYASEIRDVVDVPVLTVGRINDPIVAEHILETQKADLIVMSRALLVDPDWPNKAFAGKYEDIVPCIACNQCLFIVMGGAPLNCTMNPAVGREDEFQIVLTTRPKKVMIVGGGPAGLEAASIASLRGHRVVLYEKGERLGGQVNIASIPPTKQELTKAIRYLSIRAEKSGVQLEMGQNVTPEVVDRIKPDAVVIATGARPVIPNIPGADNPKVITVKEVLTSQVKVGQKILVVGGGMAGAETADYLTCLSAEITLLEMTEEIGSDMVPWQREFLLERLKTHGVQMMTSAVVIEFLHDGVVFMKDGKEDRVAGFDNIVLAMGNRAVNGLYQDLKEHVTELYIIGDASSPRNIMDAVREGAEVGCKL